MERGREKLTPLSLLRLPLKRMRDLIVVTDLQLRTPNLQPDHWQRPSKDQPLICTLSIRTDVDQEAQQDNLLQDSLNYGTVTKAIETYIANLQPPPTQEEEGIPLEVLAEEIAKVVLFQASAPNVRLELRRPRSLLTADSVGVTIYRSRSDYTSPSSKPSFSSSLPSLDQYTLLSTSTAPRNDILFVRGLRRYIIIGLNPCERLDEQEVIVDLEFSAPDDEMRLTNGARAGWAGWRSMVKQLESVSCADLIRRTILTDLASLNTASLDVRTAYYRTHHDLSRSNDHCPTSSLSLSSYLERPSNNSSSCETSRPHVCETPLGSSHSISIRFLPFYCHRSRSFHFFNSIATAHCLPWTRNKHRGSC